MRATFRQLLAMLDGAPARTRGQSLVELTLTLPLLLIMLLGLTEIGWYANNYMTLLDVVREAGRFGSVRDPMLWLSGEELNYERLDCDEISGNFGQQESDSNPTPRGPNSAYPTNGTFPNGRYGMRSESTTGYYDGVACSVIFNMDPLEFDDEKDDIAVSVFSFVVDNPGTTSAKVRIVGRYPARTNECAGDDTFDPFDLDRNGVRNGLEDSNLFDAGADNVRGFVFTGNHTMDFGGGASCLGSAFSTSEVERRLNFPSETDPVYRGRKLQQATNYGLVLVEVFWTHKQLLGLPWFNIGPLADGQTIHVWTFFPVSGAEPDLY
ncbi:MAG: hypothetical protein GXY36_15340 [Chloroflexi bacterium]|nr:hypothetical protein [Chloroflexota bacterium]